MHFIKYSRLEQMPESGLAIAWVMVGHDLMSAFIMHIALDEKYDNPKFSEFREGTRSYIMRLMCSHAMEALPLVELTDKGYQVKALIERRATPALELLREVTPSGPRKEMFEIFNRIRNRGTFHYFDHKHKVLHDWLEKAIVDVQAHGSSVGKIVRNYGGPYPDRFAFADEIFENVFTREVLHLKKPTMTRDELKAFGDKINEVCSAVVAVSQAVALGIEEDYRC